MSGWDTNPWRDMSTAALLRERECRQWDIADIDANPDGWQFAPESRVFCAHLIEQINGELARRHRLKDKPSAPDWPSMRDKRDELAEIKRRVSIVDFLHHAAPITDLSKGLVRRSHEVWCCCPLPGHNEDTPSFHVDTKRDVFHCFGCKEGGDLFELARHLWGIGEFYLVVERLRDIAGIEQPKRASVAEIAGPFFKGRDGAPVPMRSPIANPRRRYG